MKGKVNQPSGIDTSDATAAAGDILATKTAYLAAGTKATGTLTLTGDAAVADVAAGKTFYKDDAKTKLTGTASPIKSIQRGSSSLSGATSVDVTISPVDLNCAVLLFSTGEAGGTSLMQLLSRGEIINSTTIRFSKGTANGYQSIKWQVIEFNNVKSLQRGNLTVIGATGTTAISAVNLDKTLLFSSWSSTYADSSLALMLVSVRLVTNIRLDVETGNGYNDGIAHYQVIEFN